VPVSQIVTDEKLFQGRDKKFSERSVSNIIGDVETGRFLWENLDPITIFRHPDGRLIVLSGHSRFEAFRRLAAAGATVGGKGFDRIPAKIMENTPVDVAQRLALESNTLSTKETDIERAQYYRRILATGADEKATLATVRKNEGKNWVNIWNFIFLNPNGKTWAALKQFAEAEDTTGQMVKTLAKWIGAARRAFPLANSHEDELFEWLFNQRGYGTGSGQVANERDFMEKVQVLVNKNTYFGQFEADKPLNIARQMLKSPAEMELENQISDVTRQISDVDKALKAKLRELNAREANNAQIVAVVEPLERQLRNLRLQLVKLTQKRAEVQQYSQNEPALFGLPKRRARMVV